MHLPPALQTATHLLLAQLRAETIAQNPAEAAQAERRSAIVVATAKLQDATLNVDEVTRRWHDKFSVAGILWNGAFLGSNLVLGMKMLHRPHGIGRAFSKCMRNQRVRFFGFIPSRLDHT